MVEKASFYFFLPATEHQRRKNPHENQERQHFQQQGDGAGVPCVASPEKSQNPQYYKECRQHRTSPLQIYIPQMSDYDNMRSFEKSLPKIAVFDQKTPILL